MIEEQKDFGTFTVSCDTKGCNYEEEVDTDGDWTSMIEEIKSFGWKISKINDEWIHVCPSCAEAK